MEIKITINPVELADGRRTYACEYDPEILKDLSLALITDLSLGEAALLAATCIISAEKDPEAILGRIREGAMAMRREAAGRKQRDVKS
jgi:hypothetical protein